MTTDPAPDGVAAARADATNHLVPRAVRPIDIEHDELMARAAAEHQARTAADQARAANDRAAVLRDAADTAEGVAIRLHREHHIERSNGAYDVMNVLAALARETAAGERDEQQTQVEAEAHEPLHRWRVEILDGGEWMPCSRTFGAQSIAVDRYQSASEQAPTWADGEAVQRRLVRETTTFAVEQPAAAPAAEQPPADTGEEAQPRFVRVCTPCPECDHTLDENGACANGCRDKGPRP